jgi:hypothetical protein
MEMTGAFAVAVSVPIFALAAGAEARGRGRRGRALGPAIRTPRRPEGVRHLS